MFVKSLDNILGTFTKTLADLDTFVRKSEQEAEAIIKKEELLAARKRVLSSEVLRATKVAGKIRAIVG
jgi:hypothetical protein